MVGQHSLNMEIIKHHKKNQTSGNIKVTNNMTGNLEPKVDSSWPTIQEPQWNNHVKVEENKTSG